MEMNSSISHKLLWWIFGCVFLLFLIASIIIKEWLLIAVPFIMLIVWMGWQSLELVFLLLICTLPWSYEFNFSPTLGSDIPDEPLMLLVSAFFFARVVYKPSAFQGAWKHPIIILLLVHFAWIIFTALTSQHPVLSFKFLAAKSWYILAFVGAVLLLFNRKFLISLSLVFLFSMLAVTMLIMIDHAFLGFSFSTINEAAAPFFRNHVNYSAMLVTALPICYAARELTTNDRYRKFFTWSAIFILVALFFSYARGAWLAAAGGAIAWLLIKKRLLLVSYLATIVLTITAFIWIGSDERYLRYAHDYQQTVFHEDFSQHLAATYEFRDVSTAERFNRWVAAISMWKEHALTGTGPATFYHEYKPYTVSTFRTWVSENPERSTVHNYFLLLLVEQGVPGLVFFLLLTGAMLYYAEAGWHKFRDPLWKFTSIATGSIIAMILIVNFFSDLIETDKVGSLFFISIAVLAGSWLANRSERKARNGG